MGGGLESGAYFVCTVRVVRCGSGALDVELQHMVFCTQL